jgi:hypothetical protein
MKNLEPTPRWVGAPPICIKANLPAFESEKAARAYFGEKLPGFSVDEVNSCPHCDGFHVKAHGCSPVQAATSTRHLTGIISPRANATAHRLSNRQAEEFERLKRMPPSADGQQILKGKKKLAK